MRGDDCSITNEHMISRKVLDERSGLVFDGIQVGFMDKSNYVY